MAIFRGTYEISVDGKGRFLLPGAFRKQLPEGAEPKKFVATQGLNNKYLLLYTPDVWEPIAENIAEMDDMDPEVALFKSMFLSPAEDVEADNAERIIISSSLLKYAGITKDMVMLSNGNKMELWDKDTRENFVNQNAPQMPAITGSISQKYGSPFAKKKND